MGNHIVGENARVILPALAHFRRRIRRIKDIFIVDSAAAQLGSLLSIYAMKCISARYNQ